MIGIERGIGAQTPSSEAIRVTSSAVQHLQRRIQQSPDAIGIQFGVRKAGCSGMKYDIQPIASIPESVFQFMFDETLPIYVPHASFPFVQGCTIDYVKQGLNSELRIINPNAAGSCGCGESFSVDLSDSG